MEGVSYETDAVSFLCASGVARPEPMQPFSFVCVGRTLRTVLVNDSVGLFELVRWHSKAARLPLDERGIVAIGNACWFFRRR